MSRLVVFVLFSTMLGLLAPASAGAQYRNSYGFSFNNPVSATVNQMFWNRLHQEAFLRDMLKKRGYTADQIGKMNKEQKLAALGAAPKAAPSPAAAEPATRFKPARGRVLFPALAAALSRDAAERKALLTVFEKGMESYEAEARKEGLLNDLAGAMAYFIGASYVVYRNGETPPEKGLDNVVRVLRASLDTPQMRRVSGADKQKFYELMIGLGTYLAVVYSQARSAGRAEQVTQVRQVAGETLQGFLKLDPAKLRITEAGLQVTE